MCPATRGGERLETGNISIRVFPRDVILPRHDPYPPSVFYMMCPSLSHRIYIDTSSVLVLLLVAERW